MADDMQGSKESRLLTKARISTMKLKNFISQVNNESIDVCNLFDKRHADLMKLKRECTAIANEGERQKVTVSFNGDTQHRIRETKRGIKAAMDCLVKMHQSLEDTEEALVNNQELKMMHTHLHANESACPRVPVCIRKEAIESSETETHATADVEGVQDQTEESGLLGHQEDVQKRDHTGRSGESCNGELDSGIGSDGIAICQPESTCFEHNDLHVTTKLMQDMPFISLENTSSDEE